MDFFSWEIFSRREVSRFFFVKIVSRKFLEEIENGRIEKMNYGYREQKLSELGVNDKTFELA